jgi:hypothetical protein
MVRQLGTAVMDQATTFTYDKLGTDETRKRDENAGGESNAPGRGEARVAGRERRNAVG